MKTDLIKTSNEFIIGKNPIKEALASNRYIDSIMVAKGVQKNSLGVIIKTAKELKIPIKEVDSKKLDFLSQNANHQGVIERRVHSYGHQRSRSMDSARRRRREDLQHIPRTLQSLSDTAYRIPAL